MKMRKIYFKTTTMLIIVYYKLMIEVIKKWKVEITFMIFEKQIKVIWKYWK